MAVATVDQIKTRIETLADAVVTTLLTGAEYAIGRSTLPAVEARPGEGDPQPNGAFGRLVTRAWNLYLFRAEVVKPEDDADTLAALELCHPFLESIPDYFAARPQLQDANLVNPLVYGTSLMKDSGPAITPYKGDTYAAVRYTFTVITMRP